MSIPKDILPIIMHTIDLEGGYINNPNDAGGETNFGISKRQYPAIDIANLTKEKAAEIYFTDYWKSCGSERILSTRLKAKLFDTSVNVGVDKAVKILQRAVCVKDDGILGDITLAAMLRRDEYDVLLAMIKQQMIYYTKIVIHNPAQITFLLGWIYRASDYYNE